MLKMVDKRYLYMLAALIWGAPGISITIKGIGAYLDIHADVIHLLDVDEDIMFDAFTYVIEEENTIHEF